MIRVFRIVALVLALHSAPSLAAESLRSIAEARGLYIGAAVAVTPLVMDPLYQKTLAREFNIVVAENCKRLVLWGFTDRVSWVPGFFKGFGAALIFDRLYKPKPAYGAMFQALAIR